MEHRAVLGDMPVHIKQKIVDETDIVSQMSLRLCSKEFRDLVISASPRFDYICLSALPFFAQITGRCSSDLERNLFHYHYNTNGSTTDSQLFEFGPIKKDVEDLDFISATIDRFKKIFQNPKTYTRKLRVVLVEYHDPTNNNRLLSGLGDFSVRHGQLNVEELSVHTDTTTPQDALSLISLLEPGTLRSIVLAINLKRGNEDQIRFLSRISETEQWKQARELTLLGSLCLDIPHEKWTHLQMDSIPIGCLTIELLKKVLDSFAWNPIWRDTEIKYQSDHHEGIKEYFRGTFEVVEDEENTWQIDGNGAESVLAKFEESKVKLSKEPKSSI